MAPPRKKQRKSDADVQVPTEAPGSPPPPAAAASPADTKPTAAEAKSSRTLFIRSLPATTTTETLTALFSASRPIKHATAVTDPTTSQCKGYGFVTFADDEDAKAAKDEFHGFTLKGELGEEPEPEVDAQGRKKRGRRLRVEFAEMRKRGEGEGGAEEAAEGKKERETAKTVKRNLEQGSKVIVRNLPWTIKSGEQLGAFFEKYGPVKGAVVPRKGNGLLQGFGFVTFKGRKAAEKAIKEGNGMELEGRGVAVDWAVQREAYQDTKEKDVEEEEEQDVDVKTEDEAELELNEEEHLDDGEDGSDDSGSDQDDDEEDEPEDDDEEEENKEEDRSGTLFVRNLPFTATDEDLEDIFRPFGAIRYARVVIDHVTARAKGTGFVCFYDPAQADECIRNAPRHLTAKPDDKSKPTTLSVLQDETLDPSGKYTLDGRVLQVSRAVAKGEANRLTAQGVAQRTNRDKDRRRLFLLSEGTINHKTELFQRLSPAERLLRETSAKQRKTMIESNPSLSLSLTRLSIRNIPRSVTSKDLKSLAREAVVGFAVDVKAGKRGKLSKEEINRGGEEMKEMERARKEMKKGIVKQAKVVFEGREGGKVEEKSGAGRSRGYGFIEYHTHRNALMGLRWLNGHLIDYKALSKVKEGKGKADKEILEDRKKRLIVEFAIENAQVVQRRKELEDKARERSRKGNPENNPDAEQNNGRDTHKKGRNGKFDKKGGKFDRKDGKFDRKDGKFDKKRKRGAEEADEKKPEDEKMVKRARIIQKKRMMRRAKKQGKPFKV